MQIIQCNKTQLEIVRDLAYKIWPDTYGQILSTEQLNYMLDNFYTINSLEKQFDAGHVFLLVEEDGQYLGFAAYEVNCKEKGKAKLHKIYVMPNTQGKGIGKKVIEDIQKLALENHSASLSLNVNRFNSALSFYKKTGFKIIDEVNIDIGNGYLMEDYVMEKKL